MMILRNSKYMTNMNNSTDFSGMTQLFTSTYDCFRKNEGCIIKLRRYPTNNADIYFYLLIQKKARCPIYHWKFQLFSLILICALLMIPQNTSSFIILTVQVCDMQHKHWFLACTILLILWPGELMVLWCNFKSYFYF